MKFKLAMLAILFLTLPITAFCGVVADSIRGMHGILETLYDKMLPRVSTLEGYAIAIAGFAATFYIGFRVWKHIANAEPIDFFPLFRPFVLGFCIVNFKFVILLTNGLLSPTVVGTRALVDNTNKSIETLLAKKEAEMKKTRNYLMYGVNDGAGDRDVWMKYTHHDEIGNEGLFGSIGNDLEFAISKASFQMKTWFKEFIAFILELFYEAASLCINTLRTFNLIVCALVGPFVFALACFDGFTHTLTVYLARYINFYLWLPVANILGAILGMIQEEMLLLDIDQIAQYGDTFFTTADIGYMIFMIIGIFAFFSIPNIASTIVNPGTASNLTMQVGQYARNMIGLPATAAGMAIGMASGTAGMAADAFGNAHGKMTGGASGSGTSGGYFNDKLNG
ncbi:conjugative transposon protein TraJ [Chitinophaga sp. NPDC101104]|uniref:conjugative transposon protein TraJ n=1 Tax=Chitinophaga sp. NPDC101104 TaxID=3390561 RepID=UPI003D005A5E